MKTAAPNYLPLSKFAAATAVLMGLFWRIALLYTLLWSMCLGGNCGIWPEPALAAPQPATPVAGAMTTGIPWSKADSPYQVTGPFQVGQGVTLTILR